jgi:putative spermidine/putrescine transport system permease protein
MRDAGNGPLSIAFHAAVVAFMLAPQVVVCLVAFTPADTLQVPWGAYSLRWFEAVFDHGDLVASFRNSVVVATLAATGALLLSVPAALALARHSFPGRQAFNALLMSPLIVPHLVLGVALLRLFALLEVRGSSTWLTLAHVVIVTPYALRLMLAALAGADPSLEQAARSLGAGRFTVFRRVTLPLMLPGVTGGWLLAFINSFDEVTMSIFITSPQTVTLPVRMYMLATESIDPMMAAVSALIVALTAVVMFALDRLYGLDKVLVGR